MRKVTTVLIRKFNGVDLFVATQSTSSIELSTFFGTTKRAVFDCVLLFVLCFVVQVLSARDQHSRIKSEMNFFFDFYIFKGVINHINEMKYNDLMQVRLFLK